VSNDAEQRDTFLTLEEILTNAIKRCRSAEAELKGLAVGGDDRVSLACQDILDYEEKLIGTIEGFLRNASTKLLETRFQYLPEEKEPERPDTPKDAAAQLATTNHQITEILDNLSRKLVPPDAQAALDELHQEVETRAQQVSMISVTLHDN